ncbi:signal peptidase I [bacterium]|nr:MAG: signal peptidase I [bacterium]
MTKKRDEKEQIVKLTPGKRKLVSWVSFALAIAIALILRATMIQAFTIPSGSMEDSLLIGDFLLGEKITYHFRAPYRGEVIIFRHPRIPGRDLIKRCIAVENDTVEVRDKILYVNGEKVPLPAEGKYSDPRIFPRRDNFGPYVVPKDCVFAMGDNRDNSEDSRFWGPVPLENLKARPLFVYLSIDLGPEARTIQKSIDIYRVLLKRLFHFPPAIRIRRIGLIVH